MSIVHRVERLEAAASAAVPDLASLTDAELEELASGCSPSEREEIARLVRQMTTEDLERIAAGCDVAELEAILQKYQTMEVTENEDD